MEWIRPLSRSHQQPRSRVGDANRVRHFTCDLQDRVGRSVGRPRRVHRGSHGSSVDREPVSPHSPDPTRWVRADARRDGRGGQRSCCRFDAEGLEGQRRSRRGTVAPRDCRGAQSAERAPPGESASAVARGASGRPSRGLDACRRASCLSPRMLPCDSSLLELERPLLVGFHPGPLIRSLGSARAVIALVTFSVAFSRRLCQGEHMPILEPTDFHPGLQQDRLRLLASVIAVCRRAALQLHDSAAGERNLSLGTRTWERACAAYEALAADHSDWLNVHREGNTFFVKVDGLPIKFHRDNPDDPSPRHSREHPAEKRAKQVAFQFLKDSSTNAPQIAAGSHWRFFYQTDPETEEVIFLDLVRLDGNDAVADTWSVTLDEPVSAIAAVADDKPEAIDQPPPTIGPKHTKYPKAEDEGDGE